MMYGSILLLVLSLILCNIVYVCSTAFVPLSISNTAGTLPFRIEYPDYLASKTNIEYLPGLLSIYPNSSLVNVSVVVPTSHLDLCEDDNGFTHRTSWINS